ncbi:unnamed protein product, partial [Allacma fusca]
FRPRMEQGPQHWVVTKITAAGNQ